MASTRSSWVASCIPKVAKPPGRGRHPSTRGATIGIRAASRQPSDHLLLGRGTVAGPRPMKRQSSKGSRLTGGPIRRRSNRRCCRPGSPCRPRDQSGWPWLQPRCCRTGPRSGCRRRPAASRSSLVLALALRPLALALAPWHPPSREGRRLQGALAPRGACRRRRRSTQAGRRRGRCARTRLRLQQVCRTCQKPPERLQGSRHPRAATCQGCRRDLRWQLGGRSTRSSCVMSWPRVSVTWTTRGASLRGPSPATNPWR